MIRQSTETHYGNQHILAATGRDAGPDWFDPDKLEQQGLLHGKAQGRGNAWFVRLENTDCVLRHYFRGGALAGLLHDRYIWTGLSRTRAWREWRLLAKLGELGLPAPVPFAAGVRRYGLFYRADLITRQIPDTQTLAQRLSSARLPEPVWQRIGSVIADFHKAGVWHADLNARNILLDRHDRVFLIDFDKARTRTPARKWRQGNLQRLLRSLHKINDSGESLHFDKENWQQLIQGYRRA